MANILIIDGMASIRQLMLLTLKEKGFKVLACSNGTHALEEIQKQNFDLVLTGLNVPEMDGIALTKQLRAMADYNLTPIVVVSSQSDGEIKQQGEQAGVTDWLVKPFNPETLIATIRSCLHSNVDCSSIVN